MEGTIMREKMFLRGTVAKCIKVSELIVVLPGCDGF